MDGAAATVEIVVATAGRPRGVRGEVTLRLRTDEPGRRLAPGSCCRARPGGHRLTVRTARWIGGRFVASFDEVGDRDGAERLRGAELVVDAPADERPSDGDEYYDRQLVGLRVHDAAGRDAGELVDVLHNPAQDLLVVRTADGERLVPFVAALVPEVDLDAGRVRLADVPGLLDEPAEAADGAGEDGS